MNMEMICILCPVGCIMQANQTDDEIKITGNGCPRGIKYGKQELISPMRVVTTNVWIKGAAFPLCPVKTAGAVSKSRIDDVLSAAKSTTIKSPVKVGDIIIPNVAETGIDLVAAANR